MKLHQYDNKDTTKYAAIKMRQRIADNLRSPEPLGWMRLYSRFVLSGWVPNKPNGKILEPAAFGIQYKQVKRDLNHNYTGFFVAFLHRTMVNMYMAEKQCRPRRYNGCREVARMTGLHEVTVKDILILEGVIE